MEKKILFIIPLYFNVDDYISDEIKAKVPVFTIPYGVLSIISYVNAHSKHKVQAEILDLNLEVYKLCNTGKDIKTEVENIIRERVLLFQPNIVGIYALFNSCYNYLETISTCVKKVSKDALIVIGGGLATNLYDRVLEDFPYIDAACYGEGEISVCQLVDAEKNEEYLNASFAWITRQNLMEEVYIPKSTFVQNLDDIPFFDYSLIDLDSYKGRALDQRYSQKYVRELSIHTSRGCPFDCVFCANGKVHGKIVRYMSVEKVVSEVEKMVNLYGIEVLLIEDDHFLADNTRAKEILSRLSNFRIRIEFPNGIAVYAINDEIGELLKKAGATTVSLAVESGSDYVLKNIINKPLRVSMIKSAVDILRKNGISIHAFLVMGLPGELEEHREETMKMVFDVGFDWVYFFIAIPIAGSRLYDICKEKGYLTNNDFSKYVISKCNIKSPEIDPEYIEEKAYLMNLEVNFVKNYNLQNGDYVKASLYYESIAQKYPDHALAHYCLAKSYEGLGKDDEIVAYHRKKFAELVSMNSTWKRYAEHFKLLNK